MDSCKKVGFCYILKTHMILHKIHQVHIYGYYNFEANNLLLYPIIQEKTKKQLIII